MVTLCCALRTWPDPTNSTCQIVKTPLTWPDWYNLSFCSFSLLFAYNCILQHIFWLKCVFFYRDVNQDNPFVLKKKKKSSFLKHDIIEKYVGPWYHRESKNSRIPSWPLLLSLFTWPFWFYCFVHLFKNSIQSSKFY